jgi:hypothetical protein
MASSGPERSAVERPTHSELRARRPGIALLFGLAVAVAVQAVHATPLHAQMPKSALSDAEVEQIREAGYYPDTRVVLFVKFIDLRIKELHDLYAKPRQPGREEDTHDLIEQVTSICDELSDNLDDYGPRHADLRKALPKVLDGADRWVFELRSIRDDDAFNVARTIALESIRDLRASTIELTADQDAWFKAHPPAKTKEQEEPQPLTIPR